MEFAILHATVKGKPLYRQLGWAATSEMAKLLLDAVDERRG